MLKEFEQNLIYELNKHIKIDVKSYLGELEDIKNFEKCISVVPQILVGFFDEIYENKVEKTVTYKIYYIHKTANKEAIHRQKIKFEIFDLVETCDQILQNYNPPLGYGIQLNALKSIYEGASDYGYLAIFSREIKTKMQKMRKELLSE